MAAITNRQPSIQIEYTSRNARVTKEFAGDQIAAAKHLFAAKLNAGREPKIIAGDAAAITGAVPSQPQAPEENPAAPLTAPVAAKARKHTSPKTVAVPATPAAAADANEDGLSRPFCAGAVIAKFGVANGVTAEMVAACDAMFGKPNAAEARGRLRNALQAIKGFCQHHGIDAKTGKKLAATK
jgi:hypothetical protein